VTAPIATHWPKRTRVFRRPAPQEPHLNSPARERRVGEPHNQLSPKAGTAEGVAPFWDSDDSSPLPKSLLDIMNQAVGVIGN